MGWNPPQGGKYPPRPIPPAAPPRGYADARNKQWSGVNMACTPPRIDAVRPTGNPSTMRPRIDASNRVSQLRDASIENLEGESEYLRQRIEYCLTETRRILDGLDERQAN